MKYALLLFAFIATQAQAQIIYTDVVPNATYSDNGDTCHLDLDNNGSADYLLIRQDVPYSCGFCPPVPTPEQRVLIVPLATNVVADTVIGWGGNWPQCLSNGRGIGANLSWSVTNHKIRYTQPGGGCGMNNCVPPPLVTWGYVWYFNPGSPRYLGLRFDIAGEIHYGWARLSVPSPTSFTLFDYAYNSVPDEEIAAGDEGSISTGITSSALRGMQVAPNPFSSALSISVPTGTTGAVSCRVLSLQGQAVITRTAAATSGPSSITLDLASLAPGTYLLEMQTGGERIVRKVEKL